MIADFLDDLRDWGDVTSTDIYRVVRDASKHLDQRVQALLKAGLLISVRRHSPEVRRLPASHLLDELPNPRSRDPAQLPDLDTARGLCKTRLITNDLSRFPEYR